LTCFNATRAYLRVYPHSSVRSAGANAARLIETDSVKDYIKQRLAEIHMQSDEVLKLLADQARGDLGIFMDVSTVGFSFDLLQRDRNGDLVLDENGKPIKRPETKLIKKIKQKVTTFIGKKDDSEDREIVENEIELYDAQAALEKIGRHLDLFPNKVDITSAGEKITLNVVYEDKSAKLPDNTTEAPSKTT
jgi:hypothetical protein